MTAVLSDPLAAVRVAVDPTYEGTSVVLARVDRPASFDVDEGTRVTYVTEVNLDVAVVDVDDLVRFADRARRSAEAFRVVSEQLNDRLRRELTTGTFPVFDRARAEVALAVRELDRVAPDWRTRVSPEELNMASGNMCVLGQVFGSYNRGLRALYGGWYGPGSGAFEGNFPVAYWLEELTGGRPDAEVDRDQELTLR